MALLIEGSGTLIHDDMDARQPEVSAASTIPDDRLVRVYIKIRDAKKAKVKAHDAEVAVLDGQLKSISIELLRRTQERHNKGFTTDFGTVYIAETMKTSCADWGVFYEWIQKTPNGFEFLEQRIKSGSVQSYMAKNAGALPPGVNVFREIEARVRKPSTKAKNLVADSEKF